MTIICNCQLKSPKTDEFFSCFEQWNFVHWYFHSGLSPPSRTSLANCTLIPKKNNFCGLSKIGLKRFIHAAVPFPEAYHRRVKAVCVLIANVSQHYASLLLVMMGWSATFYYDLSFVLCPHLPVPWRGLRYCQINIKEIYKSSRELVLWKRK